MMQEVTTNSRYYVPHNSYWPIFASVSLFILMYGGAVFLNGGSYFTLITGFFILLSIIFGWFFTVIFESEHGLYNKQMDRSFRWGMVWFIFSEVMFFLAFFGALFYARRYSVPWLGGETNSSVLTHSMLWPTYSANWPTNGPHNIGGLFSPMHAWGLPAINTLILLSSGITITIAHWGLVQSNRKQLIKWLSITISLGILFLILQATEYHEAYTELNLTLGSGIYGSTFFILTGFHGLHVTIGAIILTVVLIRSLFGHFTANRHFAFEAAAWYWHFVDVVWLGLFIFVYWL